MPATAVTTSASTPQMFPPLHSLTKRFPQDRVAYVSACIMNLTKHVLPCSWDRLLHFFRCRECERKAGTKKRVASFVWTSTEEINLLVGPRNENESWSFYHFGISFGANPDSHSLFDILHIAAMYWKCVLRGFRSC